MKTSFRHLTCAACVLFTCVAAHAQQKPAAPQLRGFSVVLVQGDQEGTSSELPAAERAAINDVRDFLPFKSYRLLDSSWTLGSAAEPFCRAEWGLAVRSTTTATSPIRRRPPSGTATQ